MEFGVKMKFKIILLTSFFSFNLLSQTSHFTPVSNNNPYLPMNIYISAAILDDVPLKAGDEIAVFDSNHCVGSFTLNDSITPGTPVSIVASTDDPLSPQKDGFTPGNNISFKVWDEQNQKEIFNCSANYISGSGIFVSLGTVVAELACFSSLKISPLRGLIEGLFDGSKMVPDTIKIELRSSVSPNILMDSAIVFTDTSGNANAEFYNIRLNYNFYIVVKHRNSIETWSKFPQSFNSGFISYDFTTDSTKAYGNNLTFKAGRWCIYSGDVNQDGVIDTTDLMLVFNDNIDGVTGYRTTDLNGDFYIEVEDILDVFNNKQLGVNIIKPF